jgi:predicted outer membrane repeat protein
MHNNSASISGGVVYLNTLNVDFTVVGCVLKRNFAAFNGSALYLQSSNTGVTVTSGTNITGNTAGVNGGAVYMYEYNRKFTVSSSSRLSGNSAGKLGGAVYMEQFNDNFAATTGSMISGNTAGTDGGAFYLLRYNNGLTASNVTLSDNKATKGRGGAFYLSTFNSYAAISYCTVENNYAFSDGGAAYLDLVNGYNSFEGTVFANNTAKFGYGGGVALSENTFNATFTGCNFKYNFAESGGGGLFLRFANGYNIATKDSKEPIVVEDCAFIGNNATEGGGAISTVYLNCLVLDGVRFIGNIAVNGANGGAINIESKGYLTLSGNQNVFSNNHASASGGALYSKGSNSVDIYGDVLFSGNTAEVSGGAVYLDGATTLTVDGAAAIAVQVSFVENHATEGGGAVSITGASVASITNIGLLMQGNYATTGNGGAFFLSGSSLELSNLLSGSKFTGNYARRGGGSIAATRSSTVTLQDVTSMTFAENTAKAGAGGAILVTDSSLYVSSSSINFNRNTASYGGSAIDLGNSGSTSADVSGSTLTFEGNNCTHLGSTVYWIEPASSSKQNSFADASSASAALLADSNNFIWKDNVAKYATESSTQPTSLVVSNVVDGVIKVTNYGSILSTSGPVLKLVDIFGNVNTSDLLSTVQASVVSGASFCGVYAKSLSGSTALTAVNGSVHFSDIGASCVPTGNLSVQFTATLNGLPAAYDLTTKLTFTFRDCVDGEVLTGSTCQACTNGTYSFTYTPTAKCLSCPSHSASCRGDKISISPGYWRASEKSTTFLPCPFGTNGCVGGYDATTSSKSAGCADGYEGPLCGVCSHGYYLKSSKSECLPCSKGGAGPTQLATLIIVPILFIWAASFFVSLYTGKMMEEASKEGATAVGPANTGTGTGTGSSTTIAGEGGGSFSRSGDQASPRASVDGGGAKLGRRRSSISMDNVAIAVATARQIMNQSVAAMMRKSDSDKRSHGVLSTKLKILISVCQVWYDVPLTVE